jgi:electron transfer flavoprotein-quinone oxidoreductase
MKFYTRDMTKIDKDYLTLLLNVVRNISMDSIDPRLAIGLRLMKNTRVRRVAVGLANILGYNKILPIVESEQTYVRVPNLLANKLGNIVTSSYVPVIPTLSERIAKLQYNDDSEPHIIVEDRRSEFMKKLLLLCPTNLRWRRRRCLLQHEGCVNVICSIGTKWKHPKGEKGIIYRYG